MFWSKNKEIVYPCKPQFYYIKVGCKGLFVTRTCFRDDMDTCRKNISSGAPTRSRSYVKKIMLCSAEHEIYPVHKCYYIYKQYKWLPFVIKTRCIPGSLGAGDSGDTAGPKSRYLTFDESRQCRRCTWVLFSRQNTNLCQILTTKGELSTCFVA